MNIRKLVTWLAGASALVLAACGGGGSSGGIGGVVANVQSPSSRRSGRPLATTCHSGGASTRRAMVALRSFWSKQGKTRWVRSIPQ